MGLAPQAREISEVTTLASVSEIAQKQGRLHQDYVKWVRRVVPGSGCIEKENQELLHIFDRFTLPPQSHRKGLA